MAKIPQTSAFIRTLLPPLLARFALPLLRGVMATPAARAVIVVILIVAVLFLLIPAGFTFLLVGLATQDTGSAATAGLVVMALSGVVLGMLALGIRARWVRWRRSHL